MNLMLFDDVFESVRLERTDPRAQHLRKVLRAKIGTLVFLGFVNGARARAKVVAVEADGAFKLEVVGTEPAPAPLPITLLIGLVRPHTAKRILFEAASLGVTGIHFLEAERSEPSYAQSSLWQTDEWRDRIRLGTSKPLARISHKSRCMLICSLRLARYMARTCMWRWIITRPKACWARFYPMLVRAQ